MARYTRVPENPEPPAIDTDAIHEYRVIFYRRDSSDPSSVALQFIGPGLPEAGKDVPVTQVVLDALADALHLALAADAKYEESTK